MKIKAYRCPRCNALVYSRARHDMRWCPCEYLAVDGGFDYSKISFGPGSSGIPASEDLELPVTRRQLYQDWNRGLDVYGIIDN